MTLAKIAEAWLQDFSDSLMNDYLEEEDMTEAEAREQVTEYAVIWYQDEGVVAMGTHEESGAAIFGPVHELYYLARMAAIEGLDSLDDEQEDLLTDIGD